MTTSAEQIPETDPRFPSGPWVGFFLQKLVPGRHQMELRLQFAAGQMKGEGRDWVGPFVVRGRYYVADGRCHWTKRYVGKHDVYYAGFNEGRGIWGTWEIAQTPVTSFQKGGFHIWPEGMPDPSNPALHEEADLPSKVPEDAELAAPAAAPALAVEGRLARHALRERRFQGPWPLIACRFWG